MNKETLKSLIDVADLHASRMEMALGHIKNVLPLTHESYESLSDENLGYLELLTSRFAKLQDYMGTKIFSIVLDLMQEPTTGLSVLDKLNRLEKLGLIESAQYWISMRRVRNMVTHEYPEDVETTLKNIHLITQEAAILLQYWHTFKAKIMDAGLE